MRQISVFSMADNSRKSVNTAAETWGDVLDSSREIAGMVVPDMKILIKETKAEIVSRDTILPPGDLTIYLTPGKVKSGAVKETREVIEEKASKIYGLFIEALLKDVTAMRELYRATPTDRNLKVSDPLPF